MTYTVTTSAQTVNPDICGPNGCPLTGRDNALDTEENTQNLSFTAFRFLIFVLIGISTTLFIPLTIAGIVLLANKAKEGKKKNKLLPIMMLAFTPIIYIISSVLLIITFIIQNL
jgi:hypothetical protein